jgi:tetratricopeptide (TPR) repeat protein
MKWFVGMAAWFLAAAVLSIQAQGLDDQYLRIYNLMKEADSLSENQSAQALDKYREAASGLQQLQRGSPDWNAKVVSYRLTYVAAQIAVLSAKLAATGPVTPQVSPPPSGRPAPPNDWESQLGALRDQIRQLQADRSLLEAKLKEAFAVQPAQIDPRELARAEDRIRLLQKENDLIKSTLDKEKKKNVASAAPAALDQARKSLAEANRRLAAETERANALASEKRNLQIKLDNLSPGAYNAASIEQTRKALEEANRQLAAEQQLAAKLTGEKQSLEANVKALRGDADASFAVRTENQLLKRQVAELRAAPAVVVKSADSFTQAPVTQTQLAALQSEREILRLEKTALENRVKQLTAAAAPPPPSPSAEAAGHIQAIEAERDALQKRLDAANRELFSRKGKAATERIGQLEAQLTAVRARLDVFETKQVPFTVEELALFKKPETKLAEPAAALAKKSVRDLPPATAQLIAEAQSYYTARQFGKAETAYVEVLRQDQKSVPALASLAAIQIQMTNFTAAEMNLKQALTLQPDNAYTLSVFGQLRFLQTNYDEALDYLSRAAKLDPQDAETQNFLGLALSEKGLRGPAETALRKAIQIQPDYANAHNNLAVIYITQQPPSVEMAKWHYHRALAAGHPRNPELEKLIAAKSAP